MQVELRKNGTLQIRLKASDSIDQVVLDRMLAQAQLGRRIQLVTDEAVTVISVEDK